MRTPRDVSLTVNGAMQIVRSALREGGLSCRLGDESVIGTAWMLMMMPCSPAFLRSFVPAPLSTVFSTIPLLFCHRLAGRSTPYGIIRLLRGFHAADRQKTPTSANLLLARNSYRIWVLLSSYKQTYHSDSLTDSHTQCSALLRNTFFSQDTKALFGSRARLLLMLITEWCQARDNSPQPCFDTFTAHCVAPHAVINA